LYSSGPAEFLTLNGNSAISSATDAANGMNARLPVECFFGAKYFQQHFSSYCSRTDGIDPNTVTTAFDRGGLPHFGRM
jgi:hypothetical protein